MEILSKWEEANQKLFEGAKVLEMEENDVSLLEVTKEEVNRAKETEDLTRRVSGPQTTAGKEKEAAKKKKEEEEEMRRYVEELKRKEEEIKARLQAKEQSRRAQE